MTGLDTNVLVRFFAQDDPAQSRRVDRFFQTLTPEEPGFISLVALVELVWVLQKRYRMQKAELIECLERLLDSAELVLENQEAVEAAVRRFARVKADFADCVIESCGRAAGCTATVTFDVKAGRSAGMKML